MWRVPNNQPGAGLTGVTESNKPARPVIFVVDDEPMLLELAAIVLEPAGYRVEAFRDPNEALAAYQQSAARPELVITDYAMRPFNGMDLVARCKALHAAQKVVLVSGTVGREVFENASVKPDSFLAKPYQAEELRELVRNLIG